MDDKEIRDDLLQKTVYIENLINECTSLKKEWEQRIQEAKNSRDNFILLTKQLATKNNE